MANTPDPASFSSLPMEMKTNVFAFIRAKTTIAAVRLVSREWQTIIAPMAFENLTVAEPHTTPEMLATLMKPGNGIIPHVHSLFIARLPRERLYEEVDETTECIVNTVISRLPGDGLHSFTSQITLRNLTLLALLQHQTHLKRLDAIWIAPDVLSINVQHPVHASWVVPRLASIETLTVMLDDVGDEDHKAAAFFIRNTPRLKALTVQPYLIDGVTLESHDPLLFRPDCDIFGGPFKDKDEPPKLELSQLSLDRIILKPESTNLIKNKVALSKLKSLQIMRCFEFGNLVTALLPDCNLTKLNITTHHRDGLLEQTVQAIEALLNSFSGLEVLWLNLKQGRRIDLACIAHHGASLQQLGLVSMYDPPDLAKLLPSVPHLEGLAVKIDTALFSCSGRVDDTSSTPASKRIPYASKNTLKTFSTALPAAHPALKYLHILNHPIIYGNGGTTTVSHRHPNAPPGIDDEYVEFTRIIMHKYATHILSYLSASDLELEVLGILPSDIYEDVNVKGEDVNGHVWPGYYYTRRKEGEGEKEKVVAVPMRLEPGPLVNTVFKDMFGTK